MAQATGRPHGGCISNCSLVQRQKWGGGSEDFQSMDVFISENLDCIWNVI